MTVNGSGNHLPELNEDYAVTAKQIQDFQQHGHAVLRGVASQEEVAAYQPVVVDAARRLNKEKRSLQERDTYGRAFLQISNIWEKDEQVKRFVMARRFAKIAAELMGVDGVRVYHDQALFKEPGGGHTPWHQDQIYWPLETNNTITMWMPLINISEEMGSMTFADESHRWETLNRLEISDRSHAYIKDFIADNQLRCVTHGAMAAGDATFHYGWTLHSAPNNPTDRVREVMTVIYYEDGTRVMQPDSKARDTDLKLWFPGLQPGDLAASELNPLVYSSNSIS